MTPSSKCVEIIKEFEGFRSKPYLCPAGVPTIGYGSTVYEDGTKVTLQDSPISKERAVDLLMVTLKGYADSVNKLVKVPLNQNQFDALVDFAYNAGASKLGGSTLLKKLNAGDYAGAGAEFDKWVMGGGVKLPGLVRRRKAERDLFEAQA